MANDLEQTSSMVDDILKGFGNINKKGTAKLNDISKKTNDEMSNFSGLDDTAMQTLDMATKAMPGVNTVVNAVRVVDNLAEGDIIGAVDAATDAIPGVGQVKGAIKIAKHIKTMS